MIVILSKPFQPEFLCVNHLPYEVFVQQKEPSGKDDVNTEFILESASGIPVVATGKAIVLNPALGKESEVITVSLTDNFKKSHDIDMGMIKVKELNFGEDKLLVST